MKGPAAVRALCRARRLTAAEQQALALLCQASLGPPLVDLGVQEGLVPITNEALGRRSVLVSAGLVASVRDGWLPASQAAAVIGHAAAATRWGLRPTKPRPTPAVGPDTTAPPPSANPTGDAAGAFTTPTSRCDGG